MCVCVCNPVVLNWLQPSAFLLSSDRKWSCDGLIDALELETSALLQTFAAEMLLLQKLRRL